MVLTTSILINLLCFGLPRGDVDPCEKDYNKLLCRFVGGVNQIINQWSGGFSIRSFKINFSLGLKSSLYIDEWIKFAVKMGAQQLQLSCGCFSYDNQTYTFSTQLLSEAFRLRYLRLYGCRLKANFNGQFHSLRALELKRVHVGQYELHHILLRCFNLEELKLARCVCPENLSIDGPFLQLKYLSLWFLEDPKVIELSATKLTKFDYTIMEIGYLFSRVPNLESIQLRVYFDKETYLLDDISMHAPRLQYLTVGPVRLKYRVPACPTTFKNVIKVDFNVFHGCDLEGIIDLLNTCPFLQKLKIAVEISSYMLKDNGRTKLRIQRSIHSELKEVEFTGFYGTETHIELVMYLLETAIVLQRMAISLEDKTKCSIARGRRVPFDDDKRESFIKQLKGKCTSKSPVVIFESVQL